jgi:hypothetical protein
MESELEIDNYTLETPIVSAIIIMITTPITITITITSGWIEVDLTNYARCEKNSLRSEMYFTLPVPV